MIALVLPVTNSNPLVITSSGTHSHVACSDVRPAISILPQWQARLLGHSD